MREIRKKVNREYFELILSGQKTFEYRIADFECEPGDILILEEWEYDNGYDDTENRRPTGREIRKRVGHVAKISEFDWMDRPGMQAAFDQYGAQIISLLNEE